MPRATFLEDARGVHVATAANWPICDLGSGDHSTVTAARSRVVTCRTCAEIVRLCRGARVDGDADKKTAKPEPSERGTKFAEWFATLLPHAFSKPAGWQVNWALAYDALIAQGRTPEQITAVCRYGRSSWWQDKFLSPKKLLQRDRGEALFFDRFLAALKPVDGARLVAQAGQATEGKSTARVVKFS